MPEWNVVINKATKHQTSVLWQNNLLVEILLFYSWLLCNVIIFNKDMILDSSLFNG